MCVTTNVLVQETLGWISAYPEKTKIRDLAEAIDTAAVPTIVTKTANNAKYSNCRGLNHATHDVSLQNL